MSYSIIDTNDCHIYAGYVNPEGYGLIVSEHVTYTAHRVVYESENGLINSELVVDHLCRNRACINLKHLEAVTNRENVLRGVGLTAINARKTHYPKGHPYSGENLIKHGHSRHCRICCRANARAWYARHKRKK